MTYDEIEALCAAWEQALDAGLEGAESSAHVIVRIEDLHRLLKAGQACATALRALAAQLETRTCQWSWMDPGCSESDFETECGKDWSFISGGLAENDMVYCHSCGGKIIHPVPYVKDEDENT